jgi:hypothetical protein
MRVRRAAVRVLAVAGAAILSLPLMPTTARAQDVPLAQLLPAVILRDYILQPPPAGISHVAHFSPLTIEPNNPVVGIVQGFNTQMATQLATFPLGSSTGGLTYVFDESVGTFQRGSTNFGPLFAERALTIGRRKLSAGFNYQRKSYDTFEGQNLDDGSIKFYLRHQDCCGFVDPTTSTGFMVRPDGSRLNPPFEGDLIEAALSLNATTQIIALFANYGVTDRSDVGLAVPFVRVNLDASVRARILRLVTFPASIPPGFGTEEQRRAALNTHTFEVDNPDATQTVQRIGHAGGLGDIVLRTKYHFLRAVGGGLAAAVDLRLPTGDKNELLGAGGVQAKFLLVASSERGRFGQHVNIGYTAAEGNVAGTFTGLASAPLPDEINSSGRIEFVASPRLTLMGDVIGRTLRGAGHLDLASKTFEYNDPGPRLVGMPGPGCAGFVGQTCASVSLDEFDPRPGDLTLLLGTGGSSSTSPATCFSRAAFCFP